MKQEIIDLTTARPLPYIGLLRHNSSVLAQLVALMVETFNHAEEILEMAGERAGMQDSWREGGGNMVSGK